MLSEEDAIAIAKAHAESNGWPWTDDSLFACRDLHDSTDAWFVTTHPDTQWIANVHIAIDATTGRVLHSSFRKAVVKPITSESALAIARTWVLENGYAWQDVYVCEDEFETEDGRRLNCWTVETNSERMGGNATIIIDAESAEVLETSFINR